jgi:hypothetical protein
VGEAQGNHKDAKREPNGGPRRFVTIRSVSPRSQLQTKICQLSARYQLPKGIQMEPERAPETSRGPSPNCDEPSWPPLQRLRIDSPIQRPIYTSQSADPPATSPTSSLIPGRSYASQSTDPPTTSPTNLPIQRPSYASQSADTPTTSPTNSPIPRRSCTIRRPAHHVANVFADPGVVKPHNLLAHSPLCQQIHQSRGPVTPRNLPTHPPLHQRIHRSRGNYSYASQSADPLTTSPTNLAIQRPSYAIR